jgi:hypothetical protein
MSEPFPITIGGHTYATPQALRAAFQERIRLNVVDHPGQSMPTSHYSEAVSQDPSGATERALRAALFPILEHSESDVELWLAVCLCGIDNPPRYYRTLMRRLRENSLGEPARSSLVEALPRAVHLDDATLTGEIRRFLLEGGHDGAWLNTYLGLAPPDVLLSMTLAALARGRLDPHTLPSVALWLATDGGFEQVLALARASADLPRTLRSRLQRAVRRAAPAWEAEHRRALRRALGLHRRPG